MSVFSSLPRSHALRGNELLDALHPSGAGGAVSTLAGALRRGAAERLGLRSHAERGNEGDRPPARKRRSAHAPATEQELKLKEELQAARGEIR